MIQTNEIQETKGYATLQKEDFCPFLKGFFFFSEGIIQTSNGHSLR